MEIDVFKKVPVAEQDPKVRAANFDEVNLGYTKDSISDVSTSFLPFVPIVFVIMSFSTVSIERPFTRCAPQSAPSLEGCMPHTFSV